jgi:hypothetical protein
MILKALKEQSFGLRIISWQFVVLPQIPTALGPRPGFGVYYQARGALLGSDNYIANISAWADPWISQEGINEAVQGGCELLRVQLAQQTILSDGGKS